MSEEEGKGKRKATETAGMHKRERKKAKVTESAGEEIAQQPGQVEENLPAALPQCTLQGTPQQNLWDRAKVSLLLQAKQYVATGV